jgi:hypothetical protein
MSMKLNNKTVWLSGKEFDVGLVLKFLDFKDDNNHIQSRIYYKEGINEINEHFHPSDYITKGYNCTLISNLNGFSIGFYRFVNGNPIDLAYGHIKRSHILSFEERNEKNLKVEKNEVGKHMAKNIARKGFAGASVLLSSITDNIVNVNTHIVEGVEYKLNFQNEKNQTKSITLYTSKEFKNEVTLFLNTYFKSSLPEEAKKPINLENETKCFIATACYKDTFSKEVIFFRNYRDNKLKKSTLGMIFIKLYYSQSPLFYNILLNNPKLSNKVKLILDKIYNKLK